MPGERVIAREGLFLRAQMTPHLLLARIVDGVLVARKIVGPGEDRIAWLARRRINPLAPVRPRLRVAHTQRAVAVTRHGGSMRLALVLL